MLNVCLERGIVSYTHQPIYNTNLTRLRKRGVDPAVKGPARSSIWHFAWDILGGDEIYIGDYKTHMIVAKGIVAAEPGMRAYRYNSSNPIAPKSSPHTPWRHEIPVRWIPNFKPFAYKDPAPRHSVYPLDLSVEEGARGKNAEGGRSKGPLNELPYQRETPASRQNIDRLHQKLSNGFRKWMESAHRFAVKQEDDDIDVVMHRAGKRHLAELKICYGGATTHAIRAAMGQLLEYNFYPGRTPAEHWWLVLDMDPKKQDRKYIEELNEQFNFPITLAWPKGDGFSRFVTHHQPGWKP